MHKQKLLQNTTLLNLKTLLSQGASGTRGKGSSKFDPNHLLLLPIC